jgi:type I restriction enzyme S subunit
MKNIAKGSLLDLLIPNPPPPEQRAIAGALSDVDALIGALDRLITKKRDLKQAAMQQLLTGQKRLPGFHGEWEVKRLAEVIDFTNGKPHEDDIDPMGQYYLITLDSIGIDGKLKAEHRPIGLWDNSLSKDDIVTILSDIAHGNLLGLCDLIPEDNRYVLNQRVGRLRVKPEVKACPQFLRLQINRYQDHFKKRGQGTSQRHIYRRDFDQLAIELPMFPEQTAIAGVLGDMDAELAVLEQRREKTHALKQAMMQELLTGRTRLV